MPSGDGTQLLANQITPADELIEEARLFIRDIAEQNEIPWRDVESSDKNIAQALNFALDDWNNTPPPLGNVNFDTHPSLHLLLTCTTLWVLVGAGIFHARNDFSYSDGGIQVRIHNKSGDYQNWALTLFKMYEAKKQGMKVSQNLAGGTAAGGTAAGNNSPYRRNKW